MGIVSAVFIGITSLQTVISSASDGAYMRAAKYAASGMIPIVGSTVSASLGTLAGGLSFVKSSVGVSSVLVILGFAISPLALLLLYKAAFAISLIFLEFSSCTAGVRIFSAFSSALDTLISVYAVSVAVYLCEIFIFMKSGVNVFG